VHENSLWFVQTKREHKQTVITLDSALSLLSAEIQREFRSYVKSTRVSVKANFACFVMVLVWIRTGNFETKPSEAMGTFAHLPNYLYNCHWDRPS